MVKIEPPNDPKYPQIAKVVRILSKWYLSYDGLSIKTVRKAALGIAPSIFHFLDQGCISSIFGWSTRAGSPTKTASPGGPQAGGGAQTERAGFMPLLFCFATNYTQPTGGAIVVFRPANHSPRSALPGGRQPRELRQAFQAVVRRGSRCRPVHCRLLPAVWFGHTFSD